MGYEYRNINPQVKRKVTTGMDYEYDYSIGNKTAAQLRARDTYIRQLEEAVKKYKLIIESLQKELEKYKHD